MQVVALHEGVVVARSVKWQTTCTVLHHGDETFVVDSVVYPDELEALAGVVAQAGWPLSGLLCTHGDFDHLLGRLAFPEAALGVAETTAARLRAEPGDAARRLREFDEDDYVERERPLSLGQVQALPVPGTLELGDASLELLPADGHTQDGMAIWSPAHGVLCCGDYLSPVEIPWLQEQGSRSAYAATLERLRPYVERADWVVPGHGTPLEPARALAILREDLAYVEALGGDDPAAAALPLARRDRRMKEIHAENVARVSGGGSSSSPSEDRPPGVAVQHVALEVREDDAEREAAFWELLGFVRVAPPAGIEGRALWLERGAQQIHAFFSADPVVPPGGHAAVVAPDYDATLAALRGAGHRVDEREQHWGAPRCFTWSPAGHRVEVMAAPPA